MLCRCERRQSVFQMGSSFMCFKPLSWCLVVCLRGLLFWNCNGTGGIGSSFLSEIQTWVHFRDYSSPEALTSPKWLTTMLKNTSWLHSFISLCLRLISCKFSFFFHFAMSFSKISLCPPSLFFLIVFLALSNSIMAWAVRLYARHCMLFPLGWEIDYKSQVFLWSNPVLLQTKSHFLKYSKTEQESVALLMICLQSELCSKSSFPWLSFKAIVYSLHFLYRGFWVCSLPASSSFPLFHSL